MGDDGDLGSDVDFLRELSRLIFHNVTPATGINQSHTDRLNHIAAELDKSYEHRHPPQSDHL